MANQIIVDELDTPGTHGLNSVSRTYTDPGGVSRSSPTGAAAVATNTNLFNLKDVDRYRAQVDPWEVWAVFTAAGLQDFVQQERADFSAFLSPQLANGPVQDPSGLMKDLVNLLFVDGSGDDPQIRADYEAMITEQVSIATILQVQATGGEIEQAMIQLGWITDP